MKNSDRNPGSIGRRLFRATGLAALLPAAIFVCGAVAPLSAQPPATQTSASQAPASPAAPSAAQPPAAQSTAASVPTPADDWMKAVGGKQEFDVASVKQNKSGFPPAGDRPHSNFPLGPGDVYSPNGGLFTATNTPLLLYIAFAYKITNNQVPALLAQLPKWVTTDSYDIQARVDGNPTKDQMRMMMQSLLADRFKLAIHSESRQLPVFALEMVKPGKFGPQLQPHPADAPCTNAFPSPAAAGSAPAPATPQTVAGGYPVTCGGFVGMPASASGRVRLGVRNVTMTLIASSMTSPGTGVDRPVIDETGLTGTFDMAIEFTPTLNGPLPPGINFTPDPSGPTFQEALKEQLGLKLEPQTGSVSVFIVDHIEQPSEN